MAAAFPARSCVLQLMLVKVSSPLIWGRLSRRKEALHIPMNFQVWQTLCLWFLCTVSVDFSGGMGIVILVLMGRERMPVRVLTLGGL